MYLSDNEKRVLEGEAGPGKQKAMEMLDFILSYRRYANMYMSVTYESHSGQAVRLQLRNYSLAHSSR